MLDAAALHALGLPQHKHGFAYTSLIVEMGIYLQWLHRSDTDGHETLGTDWTSEPVPTAEGAESRSVAVRRATAEQGSGAVRGIGPHDV